MRAHALVVSSDIAIELNSSALVFIRVFWIATITILVLWRSTITIRLFGKIPLQFLFCHRNAM